MAEKAQATILFYLMAKPAGGFRNLGLIPELARAGGGIRIPHARRWEAANKRAHDWARRGRSSERAAWLQALYCESARAEGYEYAVAYFDLVKSFEWVTHGKVWEAARRWDFNPIVMRVVPRTYSMARRIVPDSSYTDGKAWQRGIVAGSRAGTCLFFDDLAMTTHGVREFVRPFHLLLIAAVIHMFEERLDVAVSRGSEGKAVTLASSTELSTSLNASSRRLGVQVAKREKHPGVTTAAGRRRRVTGISKRALKFAARASRVAAVRPAGGAAHNIVRHAKVPALLYGSSVVGMADSKLNELRTSVAMAMQGNTKGRSTPLTLLSDNVDPSNLINSGPIQAWATAWQEAALDEQLANRVSMASRTWAMKLALCRSPWLTV
ncbi:unnamed protein product [Prorocentrum cordatum]|uniref:Uncharacterized protein n=1 Tax=Prorocentrum cordatum TaxID=2364126 RepID=A0ABN9V5D9_9DINO|nr:unnamed protein product [Polarella glacialis]